MARRRPVCVIPSAYECVVCAMVKRWMTHSGARNGICGDLQKWRHAEYLGRNPEHDARCGRPPFDKGRYGLYEQGPQTRRAIGISRPSTCKGSLDDHGYVNGHCQPRQDSGLDPSGPSLSRNLGFVWGSYADRRVSVARAAGRRSVYSQRLGFSRGS